MFINKSKFLEKYPNFTPGMHVYGNDGQSLGRIISSDENSFTIEKGVFFPKDFTLRYEDINDVRNDKIYLKGTLGSLREWKSPEYTGWEHVERVNVGEIKPQPVEGFRPSYEALAEETVKVPVFEEELEARKIARKTGEVRVKKIVHTELKHLTVPLAHEEVRVYHISSGRILKDDEAREAFKDKEVSMSAMDEDVEVGKHTVLKEEVQLKKERTIEQRDISDRLRSESIEIQGEDEAKKKKVG